MKILGTGLTGLVGSRIIDLLSDRHQFENISRSTGVDITNRDQVTQAIRESDASLVLHLAAKTDVDSCERDKQDREQGDAWKMNVTASRFIAEACKLTGKRLIYVSTDFVFNGEKSIGEAYTEDDDPDPVNWYATTKFEGEKAVMEVSSDTLILRLAYPYRNPFPAKNDFVQAILKRLKKGDEVTAVTNHIMTPTLVDDFALALDILIHRNARGIYHVVGSESLSPYDAVKQIAHAFGMQQSKIVETTREVFFDQRAFRPFNLALNNAKIKSLGVTMHSFHEGLQIIKNQL